MRADAAIASRVVPVDIALEATADPAKHAPLEIPEALLWAMSRVPSVRKAGVAGPGEARALIDAMTAAAPGRTSALLAVRP